MNTGLRMSDILGRTVTIEWHEAVALVNAVAEHVRDDLDGKRVPELQQIEIASDGAVSVTGAARTDEPVRRLGQLLQAALAQSEPPVQLRLLVAQATAPTPAFGSVREYCDALRYFERPDRAAALRSLHSRAVAVPEPAGETVLTLDNLAPLAQPEAKSKPKPTANVLPFLKRPAVRVAAVLAVVVAASAAGYWKMGNSRPNAQQISTIALKASDKVGTALVSGISSVTDLAGLGRFAPREASNGTVTTPVATIGTAAKPTARRKTAGKPVSRPLSVQAFDLESLTPVRRTAAPATGQPLETATASSAGRPLTLESAEPDSNVYSASDAVVPPVGVRPQLPRTLPADIDKSRLTRLELVISPDGTVSSLKLLNPPRSINDVMLLSAAKAWQFRPALKDGRPVTYRKIIWLWVG
jgi:hypothetical protein